MFHEALLKLSSICDTNSTSPKYKFPPKRFFAFISGNFQEKIQFRFSPSNFWYFFNWPSLSLSLFYLYLFLLLSFLSSFAKKIGHGGLQENEVGRRRHWPTTWSLSRSTKTRDLFATQESPFKLILINDLAFCWTRTAIPWAKECILFINLDVLICCPRKYTLRRTWSTATVSVTRFGDF